MFETVVPETYKKRSRALFYETLPVSIAVHVLAIGGVLVSVLWDVKFPSQSPRLVRSYNLTTIPDPPPPPPPPAPPKTVVQPVQRTVPVKVEDVAPTIIPEAIPVVLTELPKPVDPGPVTGGVEGGVEGGVPGGTADGVKGGDVGGAKGGTVGGVVYNDNRVHVERDKPLPMYPLSQVYPSYPDDARLRHYEDTLVVRYIIGTDGRVKQVDVVNHAERKVFDDAAVRAIRNWRFRPMIKDGAPTEVVHELTVNFRLEPEG